MKKSIILFLLTGAIFTSCDKDIDPVSTVVEVTYPAINVNGEEFIHIPINGTYTEAGATLIDDISGAQSQIQPTSSDLDVTTQGIYTISYEAANSNGFKTTSVRYVLVLDYTPPAGLDPNFDISGDYLREATGVVTHVVKFDNGLYFSSHVGGVTAVPAYFVTPDTTSIDIPLQIVTDGLEMEGINETLDNSDPASTVISYKLLADGFGTGTRTFVKQ